MRRLLVLKRSVEQAPLQNFRSVDGAKIAILHISHVSRRGSAGRQRRWSVALYKSNTYSTDMVPVQAR